MDKGKNPFPTAAQRGLLDLDDWLATRLVKQRSKEMSWITVSN
jgi:hypothetical protein